MRAGSPGRPTVGSAEQPSVASPGRARSPRSGAVLAGPAGACRHVTLPPRSPADGFRATERESVTVSGAAAGCPGEGIAAVP